MRIKIITPAEIKVDAPARWVRADAPDGSFALLPRHIDFVTRLVPGLITFERTDGAIRYAGSGAATLVKRGPDVMISAHDVVLGDTPDEVQQQLARALRTIDEIERQERALLARLEADMIRRFQDLERQTG